MHPQAQMHHRIYREVEPYVEANYPDFELHDTDVSVNVILSGCNNGAGVGLLSDKIGVPLDQMAYIGDSSGDLPAMKRVKMAYAPSNAREVVKAFAKVIDDEATRATRIAYEEIVRLNRNHI